MRITLLLGIVPVLAFGLSAPLAAQDASFSRLSFSARAGAAIPFGDFADAAGTGFTLGIDAGYAVLPPVSVWAGYHYARYPLDDNTQGADDITLQGPAVGLAFASPASDRAISFGARVGIYKPAVSIGGIADVDDGPDFGLLGGVRMGTRIGGVSASAYFEGDICPPNWPFVFPPKPRGVDIGLELSFHP